MLKKMTSVVLLMLMMVVIVTSHASVKYCLCNHVIVLESSETCPLTQCGNVKSQKHAQPQSDCGCCSESQIVMPENVANVDIAAMNCSGCMVALTFTLDDCLVPNTSDVECPTSERKMASSNDLAMTHTTDPLNGYLYSHHRSARGSPPSAVLCYTKSQPFFIRYSAWLI